MTIDELEKLHAAAFKAPWVARTFEIDCPCPNGADCGLPHTCEDVEAPDEYPPPRGQCVVQIDAPGLENLAKANAASIAALHNAAPALFAVVRAAEVLEKSVGPYKDPNKHGGIGWRRGIDPALVDAVFAALAPFRSGT